MSWLMQVLGTELRPFLRALTSFNCQVLHVVVEAFVIGVAESLHILERRAHIHGGIIHCFKMFPSVLLSIKKLKSKSDKSVSEVPISPSWENAP